MKTWNLPITLSGITRSLGRTKCFATTVQGIVLSVFLISMTTPSLQAQATTPAAIGNKILKIDSRNSFINFTINAHRPVLGDYSVEGFFTKMDGKIAMSDQDFTKSRITIDTEIASVETYTDGQRERGRDAHLLSPDFFDSASYPKASFKSLQIVNEGPDQYSMKGKLAIRGTSKLVVFKLKIKNKSTDDQGVNHIVFQADTNLNRLDFGVGGEPDSWVTGLMESLVQIEENVNLSIVLDTYEEKAP